MSDRPQPERFVSAPPYLYRRADGSSPCREMAKSCDQPKTARSGRMTRAWIGLPEEEAGYEALVRDMLGKASALMCGLVLTNELIDFTNEAESSPVSRDARQARGGALSDAGRSGPAFATFGSVSREHRPAEVLAGEPLHVTGRVRELSLVNLDCPDVAATRGDWPESLHIRHQAPSRRARHREG